MRPVNAPRDGSPNLASLDPAAHRSMEGSALPSYARRRHQQQQRLVGSLAVVGVGVVIALLILIVSHIGGNGSDNAVTRPSKGANEAKGARQPDRMPAPAIVQETSKDSAHTNAETQAKKDSGGKRTKKADTEPLRPPTGKPEEDFGIRPDEGSPQAPPPPSVKRP
jgi:hypothetical protein